MKQKWTTKNFNKNLCVGPENSAGIVCTFSNYDRHEQLKDANLIAAAPEMFEALENLLSQIKVCEDDAMNNDDPCYDLIKQIKKAGQAIKKAKGEL